MSKFRNIARRFTNLTAVFLLVMWQAVFAFSPLLQPQTASASYSSGSGKVEVIKDISPNSDTGRFNLIIDGPETGDTVTVNNQGDGGSTGERVVKKDSVIVKETAVTGTALTSYNTTIVCRDLNGTGITPLVSSSPTGATSRQATFTLAEDADVVCIITNSLITGTITLNKVVTKNNGGTAGANDFGLSIGGTSVTSGQTLTRTPGSYAINEAGLTGYSFVGITGTGCPTQLGGNVTLTNGQNITCTITNDDIAPTITLTKVVTNNNGGSAGADDFGLSVGGSAVASGSTTSVAANTPVAIDEDGLTGYSFVSITGDEQCPSVLGGTVTLNEGEDITCTITNDDIAPTITVTKVVSNPYGTALGASAFPLFVNDTSVTSGEAYTTFDAGSYAITETQQTGYAFTGVDGDCILDEGGIISILLSLAGASTCTLTNTAIQPQLIVIKNVINDNNGNADASDFTMNVTATNPDDASFPGDEQGTTIGLDEGAYSVDEDANLGYTKTLGNDCSGTISIGETKTCTITNDDIAPTITLTKVVTNNNGGSAGADDFGLSVGGSAVASGSTTSVAANTPVAIDEDGLTGYSFVSITGDEQCPSVLGGTVTLNEGEDITCTIINTRDTGSITVTKFAYPSPDVDETNFTINLRDDTEDNNVVHTSNLSDRESDTFEVVTGSYSLTEELIPAGWALDSAYCIKLGVADSLPINLLDVNITVDKDDNIRCSFTNVKPATVIVTKYNDYNRNGEKDGNEPVLEGWNFCLEQYNNSQSNGISELAYDEDYPIPMFCEDGTQEITDANGVATFTNVKPEKGYFYSLSEQPKDGWHWSNTYCEYQNQDDSGYPDGDNNYDVHVSPGETLECFVGNYRDPVLNLTKSNNRPNPTVVGDTVTYTLIASLPAESGALFGATVTDLPPAGFVYVPGSWTAVSNLRGNLRTLGVTTEPTYGSPGTWQLGDMLPGEVVTLTYLAKIASTVSDGTYPDIAFAQGCALPVGEGCDSDEVIYSNVHRVNTPFVDTKVTVGSPKVLAASVLVNTGSPLNFGYALTAMAFILIGVATAKRRNPLKGGAK